jgi:alpha-mannosidase
VRESERLRAAIYTETLPLEISVAGPVDRISREDAQALEYRPAQVGDRFGPMWSTWWFRLRGDLPAGERIHLRWESRTEATLWQDGRVLQGLNPLHPFAEVTSGELEVELACNGLFGKTELPPELLRCELGVVDDEAWRLYYDFETLRALEAGEGVDPSWSGHIRAGLERFCDSGDRSILDALYEHRNGTHVHELLAMGHAHLDTAWLWPLAESYRKAVRTFSTATRHMDTYPEYRFVVSQAVHYAWIEERNPDLWERIRAKVDAGQFVPVGGSWVEPDCNVPSGESLVRQFLYGQRYFESRFGRRCTEFWSPDAFGYAGQLPQIMRECGMTRFLTQKLSWNRFNKPEHHTFTWQGDDGSEVLGHYPPADTYSSGATVPELLHSVAAYKDHETTSTSMLVFGWGDGGGGPTPGMLETLRRAGDLQGLPRTRQATSEELFDTLRAEHTIVGELYLEYHRGTYTTQAFVKAANRRCERLLHDVEFLAALGGEYPRAELERLWKLLLLQQFHDILPGSSIPLVYEDAARDFAEIEAGARALLPAGETPVNTTPFARREVVGDRFVDAPPYGFGAFVEPADSVRVDGLVLENAHLRAELAADGTLVSLIDLVSGREALAAPGNRFELYDDEPVDFDAWDIDPAHLRTRRDWPQAESWSVVTETPLRAELAFERGGFRQVVRLDAESRRLEFHTEIDWHEHRKLLKVCFPLAVRWPTATYEMPFGYAKRPTHYSTSFDAARYEVPGHRWADLSEHGFGVAVLTDSKYGYSCFGNELRVSLLRSSKSPDPEADMGRQTFAYAVMPHAGGWRDGGVVREGTLFNAPLAWGEGSGSVASVDDSNLVLDGIKRAEDSDAVVLRLYEAHGGRGVARVRLSLPFTRALRANALEDDGDELVVEGDEIVVPYRPHELVTVKCL